MKQSPQASAASWKSSKVRYLSSGQSRSPLNPTALLASSFYTQTSSQVNGLNDSSVAAADCSSFCSAESIGSNDVPSPLRSSRPYALQRSRSLSKSTTRRNLPYSRAPARQRTHRHMPLLLLYEAALSSRASTQYSGASLSTVTDSHQDQHGPVDNCNHRLSTTPTVAYYAVQVQDTLVTNSPLVGQTRAYQKGELSRHSTLCNPCFWLQHNSPAAHLELVTTPPHTVGDRNPTSLATPAFCWCQEARAGFDLAALLTSDKPLICDIAQVQAESNNAGSAPGLLLVEGHSLGQRVLVKIDPGAEHNFISSDFVERSGISITPGSNITHTNGGWVQMDSGSCSTSFSLSGHPTDAADFVVGLLDPDIQLILGKPWLNDKLAIVHCSSNTVEWFEGGKHRAVTANQQLLCAYRQETVRLGKAWSSHELQELLKTLDNDFLVTSACTF